MDDASTPSAVARTFLGRAWASLGGEPSAPDLLRVAGTGSLASCFAVTDLAVAAIGAAALAVAELQGLAGPAGGVTVDRRLASLWFGFAIRPEGWALPAAWDPIAGDYGAGAGWIRLHTNAPRHRAAALAVLGCEAERDAVARAVAAWEADALEAAVVDAGGCAAAMRTEADWAIHPQGIAVSAEPLVAWHFAQGAAQGAAPRWQPKADAGQPLTGLRVLDLTRILAGPVATRFLAGFGASVLRIDPLGWDEPSLAPDVTLGKRCARLDLQRGADRGVFERLLSDADVLVHGYRPGALEALGYGEAARRALCPALVDVRLDAYGWTGPWQGRRGFDSLVQMSTGLAAGGMAWKRAGRPVPLPVQALDHATGYLMAAAVVRGLVHLLTRGEAPAARLSLARTAALLTGAQAVADDAPLPGIGEPDLAPEPETTAWGAARRLLPPARLDGRPPMRWPRGAVMLGSDAPAWG